ncbi:MAG: hypothetical protein ACP5E5_08950 [Acidobacteriaceae bacterium]
MEQVPADVSEDPYLPGVGDRPELVAGIHTHHLTSRRGHVPQNRVRSSQHFLVYRVVTDRIEILQVLHDGGDPRRQIPRD